MKQLLHVSIWPNHKRCMCSFIKVIMVPMLLENKYSPAMLRVYSKVSEFLEENCIEEKKRTIMWDPFSYPIFGMKWLVWVWDKNMSKTPLLSLQLCLLVAFSSTKQEVIYIVVNT